MKKFAWLTFLTGLTLSGIAAFYSVIGLSMIFAGAFWSVVALASVLEVSKLVAVSWLYRYRQLAGRLVRTYFYAATLVLMMITSLGIFGYLTRAHVQTESTVIEAQLKLDEIGQREQSIKEQRDQLNAELKSLTEQSNQLVAGLGSAARFGGSSGAVRVQRETSIRREAILKEIKQLNASLSDVQRERIVTETETNKTTADVGPLRYVAQAVYGNDSVNTIRSAVVWLTGILMVVFDPMAIMLLIAANILFSKMEEPVAFIPQAPMELPVVPEVVVESPQEPVEESSTVIPVDPLASVQKTPTRQELDRYAKNLFLAREAEKIIQPE